MFTKLYSKSGISFLWLAIIMLFNAVVGSAQTGSWTALTNSAPDFSGGVMILMTDGTVLCKTTSGGGDGIGNIWDKLTPLNGSYINGTWSTIAPMNFTRLYFSAQVLPDGRLYIAGGEYGTGGASGEVYNPTTNTWTHTGGAGYTFSSNISDANSEILPDGRVLQANVDIPGTVTNYFWNPITNTYSAAPSCLRVDNEAVWVKLPDSSIIFQDNYSTTSERYIPQTNTWINDASAPTNLFDPYGSECGAGYLLPDGRVFFIGSTPHTLYYTPSGTTAPGTWANGPSIPSSLGAADAASAMMVNGKILLTVSPTPTAANHFPSPTSYYEFDYVTNTFTQVGAPGGGLTTANSCYISNMLALPDGSILFCNQGDNQYYEYVPGTTAIVAGQPTISTVTRVNCDTFQVTGTLFNGISEGAAYGDDWQMSTNYPIVRLTSGTNVYYATTYNWNRIGAVMTGTLPDTAIFRLPAGLPPGSYSVTVVANGNPSAPFTINTNLTITPTPISLCAGVSTTLTCATGGTWSSANTGIATIGATTGIVTGVAVGNTTISYTLGTCSTTAAISVFSAPSTITGTPTVCQGSTTSLSDIISGGTWSSSTTTIATVDVFGNVSGVSAGITTITYLPAAGCPATMNVTVNPKPVATITPSGATTFCAGGSVNLVAGAGAGFTYQWLSGGTILAGATTATYVAVASGSYSVIVFNANGCFDTSAITTVTVLPTISATPAITLIASGCAVGSTVIYTATCTGATSYSWAVTGTGWTGVATTTTDSFLVTIGTGVSAVITCSGVNMCGTGSMASVTLLPSGVGAASSIMATTGICAGGTATFITPTISGATSYVWTVSGTGWTGTSTTNLLTLTVGSAPAIISVYGENACGSGPSYTLASVIPIALPIANFAVANHTTGVGSGDLVTYTGSPLSFGTYVWDFAGGIAAPGYGVGPHTVTWSSTGLKTLSLSVIDSGCTSVIYTDTVLVLATTGFNNINSEDNDILIYPIPNNGQFNLVFNTEVHRNINIKISDMEGRLVYMESLGGSNNGTLSINTGNLANGVYVITLINENIVINRKLIIQK